MTNPFVVRLFVRGKSSWILIVKFLKPIFGRTRGFNAVPSSGNWDAPADLNGDGVVDLTDYTIVVTNFNLIGDN